MGLRQTQCGEAGKALPRFVPSEGGFLDWADHDGASVCTSRIMKFNPTTDSSSFTK